ncbi:MAG: acetylxylan esterase [Pirellulales bacterium]|nr:acetylxylan esterase [Pirellulales bacterium]
MKLVLAVLILAAGGLAALAQAATSPAPEPASPAAGGAPAKDGSPSFYQDKMELLVWLDAEGQAHPIREPQDWQRRREHILANMQMVMGPLPQRDSTVPLDVQVLETERLEKVTRKKITYVASKGDRVPAYLLVPHGIEGRVPAVLCLHGTSGPRGRTAGLGPDYPRYTLELAERGYVTIAPDYPLLGENQTDPAALGYASGTMKGIFNHMRAVDLLESLPEVDGRRIGACGVSLGGHNSLFVGVFDPRIQVVVTSSGFDSFADYMGGNLAGWCQTRYMPRIETVYGKDHKRLPFDFPEVLAAIAPRHLYIHAPLEDSNFRVESAKRCVEAARAVYRLLGADERIVAVYPPGGHGFPPEAREAAYRFIDCVLKGEKSPAGTAGQSGAASGGLVVDADFPGGNILVEKIDGLAVALRQDLRDTAGDWFYWCFRVRGAAGRTLTFRFTGGNVIGVRGPAVSLDGGKTWAWLGTETAQGESFSYGVPATAEEARFSFTMPYLEADLREFLKQHENHASLRVETLCRTAGGRDVELLRLGRLDGTAEHRVLLTARHHCCETMASYVLEGVLSTVLTDAADGAWLREHVGFLAVPFMDKDGVEAGDQGKNRKPHDHNRDYVQKVYPSVKALIERVPAWSAGRLRIALDLHCPSIRGQHNEVIYFVGGPEAENWQRTGKLAEILEEIRQGPLEFHTADNLPFGKGWNTGIKDPSLKSFGRWAAELPGIEVASSIEIAYANASGAEVNAESARAFGRDLARAIRIYLDRT